MKLVKRYQMGGVDKTTQNKYSFDPNAERRKAKLEKRTSFNTFNNSNFTPTQNTTNLTEQTIKNSYVKPLEYKAPELPKFDGTQAVMQQAPNITEAGANLAKGIKGLSEASKLAKAAKEGTDAAVDAAKAGATAGNIAASGGVQLAAIAGEIGSKKLAAKGKTVEASTLGMASKVASMGASIGTAVGGPVGTLVGAGVGALAGGIVGNIQGRKQKKAADKQAETEKQGIATKNKAAQDLSRLQIGQAADQEKYANILKNAAAVSNSEKGGKLLKRTNITLAKNGGTLIPRFKRGGTLDLEKENVILDGPSHEDENNTGVKGDKGLPVVKGNVKVAEIESLELILNKTASKELENLVKEFKKTGDKKLLKEIGSLMKSEINHNTYDYSKELIK